MKAAVLALMTQLAGLFRENGTGSATTGRRFSLVLAILLLPFSLLGLLLRPLEWVLQIIFAPLERLLPRTMRSDEGIIGTVRTIVYAVIIALAVRTLAYEPFNIPSGSMKPTLLVGDYLFVSKFSYGYSDYSLGFGTDLDLFQGRVFDAEPERGDVVVFRQPTNTSVDFIKRLVGLPGDRIQMVDGVLHVNDVAVRLEEEAAFEDSSCSSFRQVPSYAETLPGGVRHSVLNLTDTNRLDNTPEYVVPDGHYFMMGDNRDSSNDSRVMNVVGFVPKENLIGRAEFLFFSTNGCGSLINPLTWPSSIRWGRLFQSIP